MLHNFFYVFTTVLGDTYCIFYRVDFYINQRGFLRAKTLQFYQKLYGLFQGSYRIKTEFSKSPYTFYPVNQLLTIL